MTIEIVVGGLLWSLTDEYGWVNDEDDAALETESEMLDEIVRLRAEVAL